MDDKFAMDVLETMAKMFETLTARIEATEKKLEEARCCSCDRWRKEREARDLADSFGEMHQ